MRAVPTILCLALALLAGCTGAEGGATDAPVPAGDLPADTVEATPDVAHGEVAAPVDAPPDAPGADAHADLPVVDVSADAQDPICLPGARSCDGNSVLECAPDGLALVPAGDCDPAGAGTDCVLGACVSRCEAAAKAGSDLGCEFWAVDLDQYDNRGMVENPKEAPFAVVVTNPDPTVAARVSVRNDWGDEVAAASVPAGASIPVVLPARDVVGTTLGRLAYRVLSHIPVAAHQFNPLENAGFYSADASLLLPVHALGTSHRIASYATAPETTIDGQVLSSFLTVVAVEPGGTQVSVTVLAKTLAGGDVEAIEPQGKRTFQLLQYEVLNLEAADVRGDLTGSLVESDRRVAVFGGHVCALVPLSRCVGGACSYDAGIACTTDADCPAIMGCDHLEEQLPPTSAWGKRAVVARTSPRGKAPDLIRVVAHEPATKVTVAGAPVAIPTLAAGGSFDFEITGDVEVSADHPVLVVQFLEGQNAPGAANDPCVQDTFFDPCDGTTEMPCHCYDTVNGGLTAQSCLYDADCTPDDANTGDPSMIVTVPVERYRTEAGFLIPPGYAHGFASIVAETGSTVTLDGEAVAAASFTPTPSGEFQSATLELPPGGHVVKSDKKIGVTVYGWDRYVSYGYPAGMAFPKP